MITLTGCASKVKMVKSNGDVQLNHTVNDEAQVIVYKTSQDYCQFVPVLMNEERTKIVSYPSPTDLFFEGRLAKPTVLKNGYLLDNRGINKNVVFLNYTYEVYSKLKEAPLLDEMMKNIKNKFPLIELIYCGSRNKYKDELKEMNLLIDNGFQGCKKEEIIPMGVVFELNK